MRRGAPPTIWAFAIVFVVIELALFASDEGLLPRGLRRWAYENFAFYAIFFKAALSGQAVPLWHLTSFLTHAFLHGGFLHLLMNTAIFLALGAHLSRAVGIGATVLMFLGTAAGGALAFGVLTTADQQFVPMVGASGGIFGMLGAMKRWEWRHISRLGLPKRRFWTTVLAFAAINLVLSVGTGIGGGGVAWEAHLGGFVAGWLGGSFLTPRPGMAVGPI